MILKPSFPMLQRGHPHARELLASWPLWEGGGDIIEDLSYQGRDGARKGTTDWHSSPLGNALSFDGIDGGIDCGSMDNLGLSGLSQCTIASWWYYDATSDTLWGAMQSNNFRVAIQLISNRTYLLFGNGANTYCYDTTALVLGLWQRVVVVYDGSKADAAERLKLYYNGEQRSLTFPAGIPPAVLPSLSQVWGIGFHGIKYTTGSCADMSIWSRALTHSEIQADFVDSWAMYRLPSNTHQFFVPPILGTNIAILRRRRECA